MITNEEQTSATFRMEAARRHRSRAYAERNELIAVLARLYESHLMPVDRALATVNKKTKARPIVPDEAKRAVVCIHSPAGLLCWIVTKAEVDDYFSWMERITPSHWDQSNRIERSKRLSELTAVPAPAPLTAKKAAPLPPRRPGDFSRKRTR